MTQQHENIQYAQQIEKYNNKEAKYKMHVF